MHVVISSTMEFYGKRTLLTLMDKEKPEQPESPNIHLRLQIQTHRETNEQDLQFSPPRPSVFPQSPWTLSHLPSPPPSLLYHCIASLHRHEGNIYSIAASKGFIFTGSNSSRIRVWKQPDCMDKGYLKSNSGEVRAILAYNNMVFTTHKDHKIRIWNFSVSESFKSKKVATLPKRKNNSLLNFNRTKNNNNAHNYKHKETISCMAYYHSEGLLYTGSHDRTVKAWRIFDGKCIDSFLAHGDHVNAVLVNQDDGCVFTCSSDGSVKIWRRVYTENSHTLTMTLKFQASPVNTLALSSSFNHCFLYSGTSDGMINFWEKERLCYRFNHGGFLQGHRFAVLCVVTVGNSMVFSGSEDTTIRVWRREEGSCYHECLAVLDGHRGPVRCLAACLEMEKVVVGFLVYSGSLDMTFKVWRIKVFCEDENVCLDVVGEKCDGRVKKIREYDMSPVLSPSWVEKKLQGSSPFQ